MFFTTSWDDGNKLDLKIAKLLKEVDFTGTFYIPVKRGVNGLKDSDIKKISEDFEIGSHSFSHSRLNFLTAKKIEFEISESKEVLQNIIKKEIICFAYPFGAHNTKIVNLVRKGGYKFARTTNEGNFSKPKNPLAADISLNITNIYVNPIKLLTRFKNYTTFSFFNSFKKIIDNAKKSEIVHVAGHSWEFSSSNDFEKLSEILEYISKKQVKPITNKAILSIKY